MINAKTARQNVGSLDLKECVIRPLLRLTIEPFSRKVSHWWDWQPYDPVIRYTAYVKRDDSAVPGEGLVSNFWQTNFEWQTVAILRPPGHEGIWHLGYSCMTRQGQVQKWCAVPLEGQAAALIGSEDIHFFGLDAEMRPLRITMVDRSNKRNLPRTIKLV